MNLLRLKVAVPPTTVQSCICKRSLRTPAAVRTSKSRNPPKSSFRKNATRKEMTLSSSPQWRESLSDVLRKPRTIPIPRWVSPRHYTITLTECFGHSSFLLVAISYAVDDFLLLRSIAVAGSTAMLFFTYFHPHGRVLWLPFKWNVAFIAINSYRIGNVLLQRYFSENLPSDIKQIRNLHFYIMDPIDFRKLVQLGELEEFQPNDRLVSQGEANPYVRLVVQGELKVLRDDKLTYHLEEGNFVSECGLHAGLLLPGSVESCCTIVADSSPCKTMRWSRDELMEVLRQNRNLLRSIKAILSWDIVRKLKNQRVTMLSEIDNAQAWTERRQEQTQHRYKAILHNMLLHPAYLQKRKEELNKYRMIHHIDDEHHKQALKEVGWTPEEFQAGVKQSDPEFEEELWKDYAEDWRLRVKDTFMRVFG